MKASDLHTFAFNPTTVKVSRSRFDRSNRHLTSMNAGSLYPIFSDEVLPGDTFTLDTSLVVRMSTPIHPVMDNAFIDVFFFFVPNRLVWDHWKEFMGEQTDGFAQDVEYQIPEIELEWNKKGSIYDHFEIPLDSGNNFYNFRINALPIRAYGLIWNEWFRDQNVSSIVHVHKDDSVQFTGNILGDDLSWFANGVNYTDMVEGWISGRPLPVAKFHDLFTSALPEPQRGPAVTLPVVNSEFDYLPVVTGDSSHGQYNSSPLTMGMPGSNGTVFDGPLVSNDGDVAVSSSSVPSSLNNVAPQNLMVLPESLQAVSINVFRQAYAMQRLFERSARSGSRYVEYIQAAFGVVSPDSRQQRPEYLGGKRVPITMSQVPQTSATSEISPQGNTAAYSLTVDKSSSFTYSATEHGYIIGLACIRTDHTYQQGLNKMWSRRRRYDFYDPVFANLGEQAILNKELFFAGGSDAFDSGINDQVFGYQEAWYEYRYKPSCITGALRSTYSKSLDVWHYGDEFGSTPTLSPHFIYETRENIDRTLAVQSEVEDQFICDFYFKNICTRPMPLYSIPGLSSHY